MNHSAQLMHARDRLRRHMVSRQANPIRVISPKGYGGRIGRGGRRFRHRRHWYRPYVYAYPYPYYYGYPYYNYPAYQERIVCERIPGDQECPDGTVVNVNDDGSKTCCPQTQQTGYPYGRYPYGYPYPYYYGYPYRYFW